MPFISIPMPPPFRGEMAAYDPMVIPQDGLYLSRNLLRRYGKISLRPGIEPANASLGCTSFIGMTEYDAPAEDAMIVAFTPEGWYRWDKTNDLLVSIGPWLDTSGTAYLSGSDAHVTSRIYELSGIPWLLGCNGAGTINAWNGDPSTPPRAVLGSPPPVVNCIAIAGERLLAGVGHEIWTSELPALNGFDAGWGNLVDSLVDTPGDIVAISELGAQAVVVFKEDAIYVGTTTQSATEPTAWQLLAANVPGPVSARAVDSLPDGSKIYLARDGSIRRFAGDQPEVVSEHADAHIQTQASFDKLTLSWVMTSPHFGEVHIAYVPVGDTRRSRILALSLPDGAIWPLTSDLSYHDFQAGIESSGGGSPSIGSFSSTLGELGSATLGSFNTINPQIMYGMGGLLDGSDQVPGCYLALSNGTEDTQHGDGGAQVPIPFEARTGLMKPFEDGWGTMRHIELFVAGAPHDATITVYRSDHAEQPPIGTSIATTPHVGRRVRGRTRAFGRFFSLSVSGSSDQAMTFSGGVAKALPRGSAGGDRFGTEDVWA